MRDFSWIVNWKGANDEALNALLQPKTLARFAFTLVELLVLIAIINMLVALRLPAVQAARRPNWHRL